MAQITGLKPGRSTHQIINAHIYEDQVDLMREQVTRVPFKAPTLEIDPKIKTLKDVEAMTDTSAFTLHGYEHHPAIVYPFSV
jgi:thymidylate synthase